MVDVYHRGKVLYAFPKLSAIREYLQFQLERMWPEQRRLLRPQKLHVDLSEQLWQQRQALLLQTDE